MSSSLIPEPQTSALSKLDILERTIQYVEELQAAQGKKPRGLSPAEDLAASTLLAFLGTPSTSPAASPADSAATC
jgi:hypothetical protein